MNSARAASVSLAADVASLGEGRHFVASTLRDWRVDEPAIEAAVLVANELLANAIVHAGSAPLLALEAAGADLFVRVADRSTAVPVVQAATADGTGGRGLVLVEALADRWGTEPAAGGKTVWVRFAGVLRGSRAGSRG